MDFSALNTFEPDKIEWDPNETDYKITVTPGPFDLDAAKVRLSKFSDQIDDMKKQASTHKITDEASSQQAIAMMGQAAKISKAMKAVVEKLLDPHKEFTKGVNSILKYLSVPVDQIVSDLKSRNADYLTQRRIEEQRRAREEQEKRAQLQRELDAKAKKLNVETVKLPDMPVENKVEGISRAETGSSLSVKFVWKGFVLDPDVVDRSLCSPDEKKIAEAVKGGLRESPGLEIKEVPAQRLRA